MSRKKNQARRRKKRQQQIQSGSIPAVSDSNLQGMIADVRNALDANRPKRAWAIARQVAKKITPDEKEHLPLVTEALAARISEMLDAGHRNEAIGMANDLLGQHPDWRPCFPAAFWLRLECAGAESIRLRRYSEADDMAREIDDWIRLELTDPTCLADLASLAYDHPLRAQSRLIRNAWQEIEAGKEGEALAALRGIPRRSPFSPWRLFLQALKAYYDKDDGAALTALQHIPSETVASRAGEMLRLLIDGVPANDPRIAGLSVGSVVSDLLCRWRSVLNSLKTDDYHASRSRLAAFGKAAMNAGNRSLALDGMACVVAHFDRTDREFAPDDTRWARDGALLGIARVEKATGAASGELSVWDIALDSPALRFSALERALVLARIAELRASFVEDEEDAADDDEAPEWEETENVDNDFRESVACFPLRETYMRWHTFAQRTGRSGMAVLKDWRRAFPDDPEPLFLMCGKTGDEEEGKTLVQAFDRLLELEGRSPRVRALEPFFLLQQAMRAFIAGDSDAGEAFMDRVNLDSPVVEVACLCVRSLAASHGKNRPEKVSTGQALAALERPLLVWHCFGVLQPGFQKTRLPAAVKRQLSEPDPVIGSLLEVLAIDNEQWRVAGLENWKDDLVSIIGAGKSPVARLLELLEAMRRYDPGFGEQTTREIVFACSRRGLMDGTEDLLPVFLAYRAAMYAGHAEVASRWSGGMRAGYEEAAADCWQLVDFHSREAGPYADLIARLSNSGRRRSLCEGRQPLSKARAKQILRDETDCLDMGQHQLRILSRPSRSRSVPLPRKGRGRRSIFGSNDIDDLEDFNDIDIEKALEGIGRMLGLDDEEIAREMDQALSGRDEPAGPAPLPQERRREQKRKPKPKPGKGNPGTGPEQLNFPGFDF